ASPDLRRSTDAVCALLAPLLQQQHMTVVPGFIGRADDGSTTTMGRGGSDLTATVLAHALDAKEVILWKDVPGCMTADPRIVADARVVPVLDAREASELAYYGAKVLHPRTLLPLTPGTVLRIRPFANPTAAGTRIVVGRPARGAPVRAISGIARQAMLSVNGTGMLGVPGIAARVFGALAAERVSVSLISQASSEQSICFTVPADRAAQVSDMLRAEFASELARGEVEEIVAQASMATIAVVGSGMARTPGVAARIFEAVAHADVSVAAIAQGSSERNISFVVNEHDAAAAMVAVHAAFHLGKIGGGRSARRVQHIDLILLGAGRVARGMISQLLALRQHERTTARIVGVIDHTGYIFSSRGITPRSLAGLIVHKNHGGQLSGLPGGRKGTAEDAMALMMSHALAKPIVVDVASGNTGAALELALKHGADLVLANKVPLTAPHPDVKRLLHEARTRGRRILHEATVGAGLPVIDTLQQLHASGDRIDSVECSPSGTMGFLFSEMGRGRRFSDAVREARRRGYTEPDPRDDLSGLDVARKGLILARMIGYSGELADVELESLVPDSLQTGSADEFMAALAQVDDVWEARTSAARERGEVLRYRARATRGGVRVGLASVPSGHPLAALDGTDNLFIFSTARYRDRPLVVSGPGAGVEVTAAGVLGDVLRLTTQ
ncbi:MAG TPA: aspartate kinase, partial [Gemmatimonadaceae bacterium]